MYDLLIQLLFTVIYRNAVNNIYQKMVNFTVLRNAVLTSSKIIRHFENSKLIFTWHKMDLTGFPYFLEILKNPEKIKFS